jgi:hypothetical protein
MSAVGVQRRLQRFLKEGLDRGRCEGQDHAPRLGALVEEAVHRAARHVDEVADACRDPLVSEQKAAGGSR